MADRLVGYSTEGFTSEEMGAAVDDLMKRAQDSRRSFERRWYDNNFFDDGFHFRYLSRQQNKIVDLSDRSTIYSPMRAIPKASRQIRGVCNLLLSQDPVPVVYPENPTLAAFQTPEEYIQALQEAKKVARLSGHWVTSEFENQGLTEKLALMVILAAKHGVSFLQIWPDAVNEEIKSQVFDAFDIYLLGTVNELKDSPFIIKTMPRTIAEIKADERFDPEKTMKINPDNRHASSDIKEAYMKTRFGGVTNPEVVAKLIEKEAFIKEYLNKNNMGRVKLQKNGGEILQNRKEGDPIIRHTFVAGNIELLDEYLSLSDYPFVDYRFEPGPIYQVPLIERFIPANKSLDLIASRIERYTNTMVSGIWKKRTGENFEINNTAAGQIVEYQVTPPEQGNIAPIPNFVFSFMNFLTGLIEEQGVTMSSLGKLPTGVRSNAAIESLKESEYSNLVIATRRLKGSIQRIAERLLDLADDYFVSPKTITYMDKGEPTFFDVIGATALEKRRSVNVPTPENVVPLKKDNRVDIQVQTGMAYTKEAQKAAAKELGDFMIQLAQLGLLSPEVIKIYMKQLLETYGFGPTQEIMEAVEAYEAAGQQTDKQIQAMKVGMAEVMGDLQKGGVLPTAEQRIQEGKIATAQTASDLAGQTQEGGV